MQRNAETPRSPRKRQNVSRMLGLMLPALATILLSGCAMVGGCSLLTLKAYDKSTNTALADEIAGAPPSAVWPGIIADYVTLRDEVRACRQRIVL
jgi:hypothetical protein